MKRKRFQKVSMPKASFFHMGILNDNYGFRNGIFTLAKICLQTDIIDSWLTKLTINYKFVV
jgi:hypothetical protein